MFKFKQKTIIIIISIFTLSSIGYYIIEAIYFAPTDEIQIPNSIVKESTNKKDVYSRFSINSDFIPRLTIPTLDINARIQDVGISRKGNMSTPSNFFDVGLYRYGPLPGEKGSAIIDGHVDNGLGLKAVFGNLKDIKVGDDIYVEIEKGNKIHFVVSVIDVYDYDAPAEAVFNQNDGIYLKLITCTGSWVKDIRTHDKRLVVTAVKVE